MVLLCHKLLWIYKGRSPQAQNLFIKYCVFILTRLNCSRLQSTLHLLQYTYRDVFSMSQNSVWTRRFWCLFVLLHFFLFYLFHISNTVLFEDFFHSGKQKMLLGGDQVNMEGGAQESCCFLVKKLLNTQRSVGRCTCKSPIVKWENVLSLQTKFTEAKCSLSQQHQLVHWYRWFPRTLT